jgi:hypothetical protein
MGIIVSGPALSRIAKLWDGTGGFKGKRLQLPALFAPLAFQVPPEAFR